MGTGLTTLAVARVAANAESASANPGYRGPFNDSHDRFRRAASAFHECGGAWHGIARQSRVAQFFAYSGQPFQQHPFFSGGPRLHEAQWNLRGAALPLGTGPLESKQLVEPRQRQPAHGKDRHERSYPLTCLSRRSRPLYRPSALQ